MSIRGKTTERNPGRMIGLAILLTAFLGSGPALADEAGDLFQSLRKADVLKQPEIVREIEALGEAAVPSLIDAMKKSDPAGRHQAIEIIGRIGQRAGSATPLLIEALTDPEAQIRRNAAWALGRVGEQAGDAMPTLLETALDIQWDVRADAVWAMGKVVEDRGDFGAVDADLVQTVIDYLKNDESHHVRWSAAWSLARFGPGAEAALETLADTLEGDFHAKVRASAAAALGRIAASHHEDIVGDALTKALDDESALVRTRAAAAIQSMRSRTAPSF